MCEIAYIFNGNGLGCFLQSWGNASGFALGRKWPSSLLTTALICDSFWAEEAAAHFKSLLLRCLTTLLASPSSYSSLLTSTSHNLSRHTGYGCLDAFSGPPNPISKIDNYRSQSTPHSTSESFGSLNSSLAPCNLRPSFPFVNSTTDQLQQPWPSNPAAARRTPSQFNNQQQSSDFVLFADEDPQVVPVNPRLPRKSPSTPASSRIGNRNPYEYDHRSTSLSNPNLSTVHHDFVNLNNHWYTQTSFDIHNPLPFGNQSASTMTTGSYHHRDCLTRRDNDRLTPTPDAMLNDQLSQAAAESAGFGGEHQSGALFGVLTNEEDTFDSFRDPSASQSTLADTVSPSDLAYNHDEFTPAMPTGHSFDSLATPSLLDDTSPYMDDNLDVSPAFESFNVNHGYAPLFPQDDEPAPPPRKRKHTGAEPDIASSTESLPRPGAVDMSRTSSSRSMQMPPSDNASNREALRQRLSVQGDIPKSTRRQSRNLGPIEVDSADETAAKRAKNTMAARKSRQKKKDEVSMLENKLLDVMDDRDYWKMMAIKYGAPVPSPSPSAASPPS